MAGSTRNMSRWDILQCERERKISSFFYPCSCARLASSAMYGSKHGHDPKRSVRRISNNSQ